MKALTFNKTSWHFRLAKMAGYKVPYYDEYWREARGDNADICTYSKHVMGGLLALAGTGIVIAIIGFLLSHILLGIYFSLKLGMWFFSDVAVGTMLVIGICSVSFGIVSIFTWNNDRKRSTEYRNRPDGFVKHAYKSWKEKFCVKINFVDPNEQHDDNLRADGHTPGE